MDPFSTPLSWEDNGKVGQGKWSRVVNKFLTALSNLKNPSIPFIISTTYWETLPASDYRQMRWVGGGACYMSELATSRRSY